MPGQIYRLSVQLINRSFTGSSIRLLEVPTEVGAVHAAGACAPAFGFGLVKTSHCRLPHSTCRVPYSTCTPEQDEEVQCSAFHAVSYNRVSYYYE